MGGDEASLENPILNSPYEPPGRHFVIGPTGPTGEVKEGRRPSDSLIPVPVSRKGRQGAMTAVAEQRASTSASPGSDEEIRSSTTSALASSFGGPGATAG